jgi:Fe-S cluster biogenesis protein NfuA
MNVNYHLCTDEAQATEDKNTLWIAFLTEGEISKSSKTYTSSVAAGTSPLASKIFGFPWVEEVRLSPTSIMIKRQEWVDFEIIAEPLKELIEEHLTNAEQPIEENPEPAPAENVTPTNTEGLNEQESLIVNFLDQEVNPQVAAHGGKISFVKLLEGDVHLKMEGGCQGCGMAQATLRDGVETSLKENFDFVKNVVDTTDHDSGVKPFF